MKIKAPKWPITIEARSKQAAAVLQWCTEQLVLPRDCVRRECRAPDGPSSASSSSSASVQVCKCAAKMHCPLAAAREPCTRANGPPFALLLCVNKRLHSAGRQASRTAAHHKAKWARKSPMQMGSQAEKWSTVLTGKLAKELQAKWNEQGGHKTTTSTNRHRRTHISAE